MEEDLMEKNEESIEEIENKQEFEEIEIPKKEIRTDSYFDGGLLELIGWRILAILITSITFGIAAPWAQCMLYSWQYKHTVYNGKRLKFEGKGGDLFVHGFKWLFFTIITLGFYAIVIPIRKQRWIISNLHFEDEPYVKDESYFDGKTIQLIGVNILSNILTAISLGILYPFTVCYKLRWTSKHTVINKKKIVFDGKAIQLWGKYILWLFLTVITFGIYGLWLSIKMLKWQTKHIHIKTVGESEIYGKNSSKESVDKPMIRVIAIVLLVVLVVGPSTAYIVSRIRSTKVVKNIEKNVEKAIDTIPSTINKTIKNNTTSTSTNKKVIKRTKSSFNYYEEEAYRKAQKKKEQQNAIVANNTASNNDASIADDETQNSL